MRYKLYKILDTTSVNGHPLVIVKEVFTRNRMKKVLKIVWAQDGVYTRDKGMRFDPIPNADILIREAKSLKALTDDITDFL